MSSTETTITLEKSTRNELRTCKSYRRETWNDLMTRLIKILIIEGLNDKVMNNTGMKISSIYGALAFISYMLGISVIPTRHISDTAIDIERIAYREQVKDDSPIFSRRAPKRL